MRIGTVSNFGDFYPRSPCGERLSLLRFRFFGFVISIHALLAESDRSWTHWPITRRLFLSTLSLRRATNDILAGVNELLISIHALLAESDLIFVATVSVLLVFLSTLSLRRATILCVVGVQIGGFLSTLSLRRATVNAL